jgi:murein tripeptide amidase MpaA
MTGFHAREWISPATVTYLIRELVENRTAHGSMATDIDYHIAPLVNVDGYHHSHTKNRMWRKNRAKVPGVCNGVDLNRNFGYKWGTTGASRNSCAHNYAGKFAFSEPEAQALQKYISDFPLGHFQVLQNIF